jgi:hypothetical protein
MAELPWPIPVETVELMFYYSLIMSALLTSFCARPHGRRGIRSGRLAR